MGQSQTAAASWVGEAEYLGEHERGAALGVEPAEEVLDDEVAAGVTDRGGGVGEGGEPGCQFPPSGSTA
jgi:hypothetical protein